MQQAMFRVSLFEVFTVCLVCAALTLRFSCPFTGKHDGSVVDETFVVCDRRVVQAAVCILSMSKCKTLFPVAFLLCALIHLLFRFPDVMAPASPKKAILCSYDNLILVVQAPSGSQHLPVVVAGNDALFYLREKKASCTQNSVCIRPRSNWTSSEISQSILARPCTCMIFCSGRLSPVLRRHT